MNKRDPSSAFLATGGAVGARIAAMDWSAHALGPVSGWDPALRTGLGIVLSSSFPAFLAWGEEMSLFHNDPYRPMLGKKDNVLGRPYSEVWHEVWDTLGSYARRVLAGESFFFEDYATTLERNGFPEPAWFTFSYSPLRDEAGEVRGLICTVVETTGKVTALARHREAEERLALSLEASGNIGTWSYGLDDGLTTVDERFARLFQVDAALARSGTELTRFTDVVHPDDRARVVAAIAAAVRDGTLYDIEYRIPQKRGVDTWVNARGKVFTDPGGGQRRFAGIAVDITARKAAEQALRDTERAALRATARADESRRRLDALLDAAPVGIVYVDAAGGLLAANATNRVIWGEHPAPAATDEYAAWRGWWPTGSERAGQVVGAHEWPLALALAGADTAEATVEIEPFGRPGVRKTILVRAQALRDEHGLVAGAVAANMDVTAQVAAERALQASEQKFRNITNLMPQMVWSSGVDGRDQYVNRRWHEFTGLERLGDARNGWRALVHPDDLPELLGRWRESFTRHQPL
ncbi:PAS domain-containing protein [Massilia sp. Se16.2.3]|uniref:PAS domain-containing protein n=1 Tax=Massilia sp. Se16.2.3 TaxID=2709303 RepID=UPI001603194B|nr:PAS domain-containing protein [Massilia sp. Se16.2.3]QNB00048.1 PAS domain S-box protein [Massilia sp. Se16.2.3]